MDSSAYQMYMEHILDHYRHPRNYGHLEDPDVAYEDANPLCGDRIGIELKVEDGRIADIRFHGEGCAISQASASILTELVKGKSLEEVRQMTKEDLLEALGIPLSPVRLKCALLSLKVLKVGAYGVEAWAEEDEVEDAR